MNNIFGLLASCLFIFAGWSLRCNPAKALDFVFGKDDQRQSSHIQLFSIFGIVMMAIGSLSALINLLMAVVSLFK